MDELTKRLREADPVAHEPELSGFEAAVMRQRAVLAAGESGAQRVASWKAAAAVAGVAAIALAGTLFDSRAGRATDRAPSNVASEGTATAHVLAPGTQVQFQTPGGTRVVWMINPELTF